MNHLAVLSSVLADVTYSEGATWCVYHGPGAETVAVAEASCVRKTEV